VLDTEVAIHVKDWVARFPAWGCCALAVGSGRGVSETEWTEEIPLFFRTLADRGEHLARLR
jgi:hypothetical protein